MSHLTTTYLLPAILLNPPFVMHLINTFTSHLLPPPPTQSYSPHPFMESLGPLPGSPLLMDMHQDDVLCWRYTFFMVVLQMLAFGRVQDNRSQRKARREERRRAKEEARKAGEMVLNVNGNTRQPQWFDGAAEGEERTNGEFAWKENEKTPGNVDIAPSEESFTETSEEEMIS